jgi:glycosyltransferase involved in cell wall biosynthesis
MNITIAVTNDVEFDQRVNRIANSLCKHGYQTTIVGRSLSRNYSKNTYPVQIERLTCFFNSGFLFYLEFNIRLFFYLIKNRPDIIYACDPDTLLGSTFYKKLFGRKGIYDAHELFSETPEINDRKFVKWIWTHIEKSCVRYMDLHLTVNQVLVKRLTDKLKVKFSCIRNVPFKQDSPLNKVRDAIILYQGVLNKGRGIEALITMMEHLPQYKLLIAGDGDIANELKEQATSSYAHQNIKFLGKLSPDELKKVTLKARWGYNLLDGSSENYYLSLANKFFDYMAAGVPSINMNFPLYKSYVEQFSCGILLNSIEPFLLAETIKVIDQQKASYNKLVSNSILAHQILNWENEEKELIKLIEEI